MKRLQVDSIRKSYHQKLLLSDIYLSCEQGEVIGLLGRNGSGKSTLLKIIFGEEKAENKFVKVQDRIIKNVRDSRRLINYLPQKNFVPGALTIKTLISLFISEEKRKTFREETFIEPFLQQKFRHLSGGEKRMIEIMLLLYSEADFILLDEPFEGISPITKELIIDNLQKVKPSKGFIITDHDYENVIKVADRILLLQHGALKEIKNRKDLEHFGYVKGL